jgi:UDP-N-acetylmuramoyl-L-alanyl-D-glutamate--2,6-diaminopimelate ligase
MMHSVANWPQKNSEARLISYSLEDSSAYLYCREAQFNDEGVRATAGHAAGRAPLAQCLARSF